MSRVGEFFVGALFRNWGSKLAALAMSLIIFVLTRDEVSRTYLIPLRSVSDPDRVLLTELPDSVRVEVRGPWTRINKLTAKDLGAATVELAEAKPGPLELEPGSIVMPPGVFLKHIEYDPVDLRFDPITEVSLPVVARVLGEVHADYELVHIGVEPNTWSIRGGESVIMPIAELDTGTVNIQGAKSTATFTVDIARPGSGVSFVGSFEGDVPQVEVTTEVRPLPAEKEYTVEIGAVVIGVLPNLDPGDPNLPRTQDVKLRGPKPAVDAVTQKRPVLAAAEVEKPPKGRQPATVVVRFGLDEDIPEKVRDALTIEPASVRLTVAPSPPRPDPEP